MIDLKKEYPYNGNNELIKHYAQDENGNFYKIKQVETGFIFDEAVDAYPAKYEYSATEIKVEGNL
jgi:hypothetical protein